MPSPENRDGGEESNFERKNDSDKNFEASNKAIALQNVLMIVWVTELAGNQTYGEFFAEQRASYSSPAYLRWDESGMREKYRLFIKNPDHSTLLWQICEATQPLQNMQTLREFMKADDVKSEVRKLANLSELHDLLEKIEKIKVPPDQQ